MEHTLTCVSTEALVLLYPVKSLGTRLFGWHSVNGVFIQLTPARKASPFLINSLTGTSVERCMSLHSLLPWAV